MDRGIIWLMTRFLLNLKRRFFFMTWIIILIPLFSVLITIFAFTITWSISRDDSEDLSAPRYLKGVLEEALTTGSIESEGFAGLLGVFDSQGDVLYIAPEVLSFLEETQASFANFSEAYEILMNRMPPSNPLSFSVYNFKGESGVVLYSEDYFTRVKLFKILGSILFGLYFCLIVVPVLLLQTVMKPLRETLLALEQAAGEIGRGNLEDKLVLPAGKKLFHRQCPRVPHPPVLKDLCSSFENMRLELKENQERQSRIMMSVSHDLKTPLTLIKGYVEALQDGLAETPEEVVQYAEVIHDRASLLEDRISDLIYFSKLQTTDWQGRFEPIDILAFLQDISGIFKNDTFIRKRQYLAELAVPPGYMVRGDSKMLTQVLENVFDNSCRYTDEGDRIRMSAGVSGAIIITIEDSGPGVQSEHVPYIFDNYYRADAGRNTRGTGIGLASAKIIIRNHGGDIVYTKSEWGGAGFKITLPVMGDNFYNVVDE